MFLVNARFHSKEQISLTLKPEEIIHPLEKIKIYISQYPLSSIYLRSRFGDNSARGPRQLVSLLWKRVPSERRSCLYWFIKSRGLPLSTENPLFHVQAHLLREDEFDIAPFNLDLTRLERKVAGYAVCNFPALYVHTYRAEREICQWLS